MGSKPDPVLAVLNYFETADLALAQQAFVLARAILRKRSAPARVPVKAKPPKLRAESTTAVS
jgi:hypothetical protein